MREIKWSIVLCLVWVPLTAWAEGPKLVNEKPVFTGAPPAYRRPTQYHAFSMRLSPDGRHLLYPEVIGDLSKGADGTPDWIKAQYKLVIRALGDGKSVALPVSPVDSGMKTFHTRFNLFDPAGQWLAVPDAGQKTEKAEGPTTRSSRTSKIVFCQVGNDQVKPTALGGGMVKFDRAGKGLVGSDGLQVFTAALSGQDKKALKAEGFVQSVCPTADVICVWTPPKRIRSATAPASPPQRGAQRLSLYDLTADKELAELPINQRNSGLDDWETQWTPDGRFLFYYDVQEVQAETPQGPQQRTKTVARIWDRVENKPAGEVADAFPVGPGPAPSSVWLAKWTVDGGEGGFLFHDAKTGADHPMGDATMKLIHAVGAKVVYAKTRPDGPEEVLVAEVALPKEEGK